MLTEATDRAMRSLLEQERQALEQAIRDGYDGMDVYQDLPVLSWDPDSFRLKLYTLPWDNEPPMLSELTLARRYDFRDVDRGELVAMIQDQSDSEDC